MLGQIINGQPLRICDGCGCSENFVELMIVLETSDACICNECVGLCGEIVTEHAEKKEQPK